MGSGESVVGGQLRTWLARALCLGFAGWLSYLALRFGSRAVADDAVAWAGQGGVMLVLVTGLIGWWLVRRRVTFSRVLMAPSGAAFIGGAFALALVTGLAAHHLLLHGVPDVPDELGYLHQARSFADGWLAAPSPPLEEFHYASWAIHDAGSWYAVFPPGYGVLLGLGVQGGVPGLVNPLLGALLCLIIFELGKELFGGDGALPRLAVLLYLASWFRMLHAGSFMAHPTAALATGVALLGVLRGVGAAQPGRRALVWAAAAGAAGAALLATRPLNAVLLAVALLPVVIARVAARPRPTLRGLLHVVVAAAPLLLAYGAYDRALTGSPLLTPQQRYMQLKEARKDCFRLGFGPGVGQCPITQNSNFGPEGFQLHDAKNNTARRLASLQRDLFAIAPLGWLPILGLLGGALGAAAAARRRALYGWLGLVTILGYGLFFYHGVAYGARFYDELLPAAALLAAAALGDLGALPDRLPPGRVRGWLTGLGGALAWSLPAILVVALLAGYARVAPNGKRARTDDGRTLDIIRRAGPDAVVFVDSMVVPAAMLLHPAALGRGRPLVVADLGDAANAGYLRTPQARGRRPFRLVAGTLVAQSYAADAPVRHEAGNKYPLQVAHGGFGDRVGAGPAGGNPVSGGELLRFRLGVSEPVPAGGAWFGFPIWVAPEDAGALTVHIEAIATAQSPRLGFAVDGASLGPWQDTSAAKPTPRPIDLPATLSAGAHWLTVRADGQTGTVLLDYVELRPAARR